MCPERPLKPPARCPAPLQAEVAGLEREVGLARRQAHAERRKQTEMARERGRCALKLRS